MASGRKGKTQNILAVDEKRLQGAEFWAAHPRSPDEVIGRHSSELKAKSAKEA